MPDYDAGFKIVARDDVVCDAWEPVTGEVHAAERLADRAFRARKGKDEFIVYMEAYTRWEAKAPWSVLAKSGLLSERERLPCKSLVFVLLPRGYKEQHGTFRLAVNEQATQQIWFREICLWKLQMQPEWEAWPGMMALAPFFQSQEPIETVIANAARCIKRQATDRIREADLLTVLAIFGKLTHPGFNPLDIIGREAMRESPFYDQIQNEVRQANIIEALEIRFGKIPAREFKKDIFAMEDSEVLSELHRVAIKVRTLSAFRKALAQKLKSASAT